MNLNKKKVAAVLTALAAIIAAVLKFMEAEPATELPPVEVPVIEVAPDASL